MIDEKYSLVLLKNEVLFSSNDEMLWPLVECIKNWKGKVNGCFLYDKVVGLAAAKLIVHSGLVSYVKTPVISAHAKKHLDENSIRVEADSVVEYIMNKEKTDLCPMEKKALESDDFIHDLLKR